MHPNRKFHIADREEMARLIRSQGFGVVTVQTAQGLRAVHVPVLIDGETLLFHVSKGNAVHAALVGGCEALFVANGPHSYVSADDYGLPDRVPTWSYVAVELNGRVRPLGEPALIDMLDAITVEQEAKLAPKTAWTRDRTNTERFDGLLKAITGFEMEIEAWRGTAKIDPDKPAEVRTRIGEALAGRGEAEMAALYAVPWPRP